MGMICYRLKKHNIRKHDEYIQKLTAINTKGIQRVIYMDESYIHKNYQQYNDSLFDPNDEQDLEMKANQKGRRYCFIAAIVDADYQLPTLPINQQPDNQKAHLMLDTLDIFEGGKSRQ